MFCDICRNGPLAVYYDARTKMGCWATLCEECFSHLGVGLGIGKGQKYEKTGNGSEYVYVQVEGGTQHRR